MSVSLAINVDTCLEGARWQRPLHTLPASFDEDVTMSIGVRMRFEIEQGSVRSTRSRIGAGSRRCARNRARGQAKRGTAPPRRDRALEAIGERSIARQHER